MKKYKLTIIGLIISILIWLITLVFEIELFEKSIELVESLEAFELDELLIPGIILLFFAFLDQRRRQNLEKVEQEKVKIYRAMLFSTHHIMNNFINEMQIFKMTAEDMPDFDPEVLSLYEHVIKDSTIQIEALGSISEIDELTIHSSIKPK